MTDLEDRILDLALDEIVGGPKPPDVSDRVLAELSRRPVARPPKDRWRNLAMAAAVMLFAGVLWTVLQDDEVVPKKLNPKQMEQLIENLRSENEVDRDYGLWELKNQGNAAKAVLEKATLDKDPEIAKMARQLLRRMEIKELLTPKLMKAFSGLADRLSSSEEAWLVVLREAVDKIKLSQVKGEQAPLGQQDLELLAAPAVRGAITELQKQEAVTYVMKYQLRSGTPETAKLLKDPAMLKSLAPLLRNACQEHQSELWRAQRDYAKRFGRMPRETGAAFWQALTTSEPPIVEPGSAILTCPARFLAGVAPGDQRTGQYWGPRGAVDSIPLGSAVGLCDDPLHGAYMLIQLKSGDQMSWLAESPIGRDAKAALKPPWEK